MKPKSFRIVGSAGGPTFTPVWVPDKYNNPANIGIMVVVSGAEAVVDVQHTGADPWSQNLNIAPGVSAAWENNATLVSATQAGQPNGAWSTNYAFYPNAIRGRIRALASAGTGNAMTVTFIQAGPEN
jgi:hypothetical protein